MNSCRKIILIANQGLWFFVTTRYKKDTRQSRKKCKSTQVEEDEIETELTIQKSNIPR